MPNMLPFSHFWAAFLESLVTQENCERVFETVLGSSDSLSLAKQFLRAALTETSEPIFKAMLQALGEVVVSYTVTDTRMPGTRPTVLINHVMMDGKDMVGHLTVQQLKQLEQQALEHSVDIHD